MGDWGLCGGADDENATMGATAPGAMPNRVSALMDRRVICFFVAGQPQHLKENFL